LAYVISQLGAGYDWAILTDFCLVKMYHSLRRARAIMSDNAC
jgi:hypothetical protein